MGKKKSYIVGGMVLLMVLVVLICSGTSRCSKTDSDGQGYENVPKEQKDEVGEKGNNTSAKDNQLELEETPKREEETGKFDDWLREETTENTDADASEEGNKVNGSDNNKPDDNDDKTQDDDKTEDSGGEENKGGSLSSSDTDEHSNIEWSPFY